MGPCFSCFYDCIPDQQQEVPVDSLDEPCRDIHLRQLASCITDWKSIAPYLDLTEVDEEEIQEETRLARQRIGMLRKWKQKFGRKATYRRLEKAFYDCERADLVDKLRNFLLVSEQTNRTIRCQYANFLKARYQSTVPTFLTLQWPPPPTYKVFNLAMISQRVLQYGHNEEMVRLLQRGKVSDVVSTRNEVTLEQISRSLDFRNRKIILIEGAPGSGKSTLSWHLCKMWQAGELFQQFEILLFVQLREPAIQSAKSLVDLFPAPSLRKKEEVVSAVQYYGGRQVLIILDSWDEFPPGLESDSVIKRLICNPSDLNMHFSALIISSRPIATAELQKHVCNRIEIAGFLQTEIKRYFTEVLEDPQIVQNLYDHLKERPVIEASCYLPLNTAIVAHLFCALNYTLPNTLHDVFTSLVICCIIRHMAKQGRNFEVSSLDDLPADVQEHFNSLCSLAYHGVRENKVTFSAADLKSFKLPTELSTLSLIQGVASFTAFGKSKLYNFLHLSTQELLAGIFISKMPEEEQVKVFKNLFKQPRFSTVFQFYAAFTKLKAEGIRSVVSSIVKSTNKTLLVPLLHCLYEAQDDKLCQFVASEMIELDISDSSLTPLDCLSVGYFTKRVCLNTNGDFKLTIHNNRLDRHGASLLVRELSKYNISSDDMSETPVQAEVLGYLDIKFIGEGNPFSIGELVNTCTVRKLNLSKNILNNDSVIALADSLRENYSLKTLKLGWNAIRDDSTIVLADALKANQSLTTLDLKVNEIEDQGTTALTEALRVNQSLTTLSLAFNKIGDGGTITLAEGLRVNQSLTTLNLKRNGIHDNGAIALADAMKVNHSLTTLILGDNEIQVRGGIALADALRENKDLKLTTLNLKRNKIEDSGVTALADALKVNKSLSTLNLKQNQIEVDGATALADALGQNQSLKTLNLKLNGIQDTGATVLARALKVNQSLTALNLEQNRIQDIGTTELAVALRVNRTLTTLNLGCLEIQKGCAIALANALKVNQGLTTVKWNCGLDRETGAAVADALRKNKKLQIT